MDIEQRAIRAKQLRDDPLLSEILATIREEAIAAWVGTKVADSAQREFSWLTVKVLDRIDDKLQAEVDNWHMSARAVVKAPQ